jgi:hypothetical protein
MRPTHYYRASRKAPRIVAVVGGEPAQLAETGECDRLGEAIASGQDVNHRFLARHGDPVELHPAVDHDEERRRRVTLPKQGLVRLQHDGGRRRDDLLDGLRLEALKDGNAGDDLKIPGRGMRGHVASHASDIDSMDQLAVLFINTNCASARRLGP